MMSHENHHDPIDHQLTRVLELDATVFEASLTAALDLSQVSSPRGVVDLGAGTGTGSRMLRSRFPEATITAVDNDPSMIHGLRNQGFEALKADLDAGFPHLAAGPIDLVWAASSLHHVGEPDRLLSGIRRELSAEGELVVVEISELPRFLSDPADAQLEQRCLTAASAEGWNTYPDWTTSIEAAGFRVSKTERQTSVPPSSQAREYAQHWLPRYLQLETLSGGDRTALSRLLENFSADTELDPRITRTVWVGTPV